MKKNNIIEKVVAVITATTSLNEKQANKLLKIFIIKTNFLKKPDNIRKHTYFRLKLFVDFCNTKEKYSFSKKFKPQKNIKDINVLSDIYNIFLTSNYCRFLI